jgi:hypothetical protein
LDFSQFFGKKIKATAQAEQDKTKKADKPDGEVEQLQDDMASIVINKTPIKPCELRVVVDNMLHGLGKELRRCGVDAVIIDNDAEHSEVARVSLVCRLHNPLIINLDSLSKCGF